MNRNYDPDSRLCKRAKLNPNAHLITGVICDYRVEDIEKASLPVFRKSLEENGLSFKKIKKDDICLLTHKREAFIRLKINFRNKNGV